MFADSVCCFYSLHCPMIRYMLPVQVRRIARWFPATARLSCWWMGRSTIEKCQYGQLWRRQIPL